MYSFSPLASIPVSHDGMFIMCLACFGILAMVWMCEGLEYFVLSLIPVALVVLLTYCVSYVWTDQTPKTFVNTPVVGTFIKYESEGYKEKSGKSYVDRHFTYIVYSVDGGNVMLPCKVGVSYPERVTLYKN